MDKSRSFKRLAPWYRCRSFADYLFAGLNREAGAVPTYTLEEQTTPSPAFAAVC